MRKLVMVDPVKLDYVKAKGRDSPTRGDCGEIDDVRAFVRHAARIIAELGLISHMNPELLVTFTNILKSEGEEEAICRIVQQISNKKKNRRRNATRTYASRQKGSTNRKAKRSSKH